MYAHHAAELTWCHVASKTQCSHHTSWLDGSSCIIIILPASNMFLLQVYMPAASPDVYSQPYASALSGNAGISRQAHPANASTAGAIATYQATMQHG